MNVRQFQAQMACVECQNPAQERQSSPEAWSFKIREAVRELLEWEVREVKPEHTVWDDISKDEDTKVGASQ